jgi:O-antigen/teichoic acid export membrane protein
VIGGAQAAAALTWGLTVLVVLPLGLGSLLLKDLWNPAWHLLPAVILNVVAACFITAASSGLRAMGVARRSLRAQLIASALYLVGGLGGAVLAGAAGTVWGVAAATTLGALVTWHQLRLALAEHAATPPPNSATPNSATPNSATSNDGGSETDAHQQPEGISR